MPWKFGLVTMLILIEGWSHICAEPTLETATRKDNVTDEIGQWSTECTGDMAADYCLNGGICMVLTINDSLDPYCECADGFMGARCENEYEV